MRIRAVAAAMGCVTLAVLMFSGPASAATVVGSTCVASRAEPNVTVVSLRNPPANPLPSAIPSAGVITSWSVSIEGIATPGVTLAASLKVFAPVAVPNQLQVVGESEQRSVNLGTATNPTRIPVKSGDLLGNSLFATNGVESVTGAFFCETADPGDATAFIVGDPGIGTTVSFKEQTETQNPVTVNVEPDVDGDGYGDETQDKCPTDASAQGTCPLPPAPKPAAPPITLSASAAAKKGLVTVSLTSSAQVTVTVGGSVKLAKGKTATLAGSTQIVAPGSLAKFTLLFPAKLKTALKETPPGKKLSLVLSASAPGATTANLTVKVPGQKKVVHHRHKK